MSIQGVLPKELARDSRLLVNHEDGQIRLATSLTVSKDDFQDSANREWMPLTYCADLAVGRQKVVISASHVDQITPSLVRCPRIIMSHTARVAPRVPRRERFMTTCRKPRPPDV